MGIFEVLLVGLGLSMDAAAVSISNSFAYPGLTQDRNLSIPLAFGLFQGIMPLLGFYAGNLFADFISTYAGIITLLVLGVIGGKMIWDSCKGAEDCSKKACNLPYHILLVQAVATSIDAFAVGVSFCAMKTNIWVAAPVIAATTFFICLLAGFLGKKFGCMLGNKAQLLGGIILVLIGIKALF